MDGAYNKDMLSYHRRVNRKESLVGWYTTTSAASAPADGSSSSSSTSLLSENSAAQYQFYKSQVSVMSLASLTKQRLWLTLCVSMADFDRLTDCLTVAGWLT